MINMISHSDSPEIIVRKSKDSSAIQSAEVQASWQWDEQFKAESITIDTDKHVVLRNTSDGRNPCVLASEPLTKQKDCFRVKIDRIGRFIGIGVADRGLVLDNGKGKVLGGQTDCINAAYYTQSNTIRKLHSSDKFITQAELIRVGDVVDTKVDFSAHKVYFWLNNKPQGSIDLNVEEGVVYPAITLSQFSKVTLLTLDHISEGLDLETRLQQMLELSSVPSIPQGNWQWSCNRKSPAINVTDRDCRTAIRVDEGYNPCIITTEPFSKTRSHFRVQVTKLSNFLGIGVTHGNKAVIEGGSILGQQNIGAVNASYFWNESAPPKLFMFGEDSKIVTANMCEGSIVDVQVEFDSQRVYYWIDDIYVGHSRSTRFKLVENEVFPCVNLSNGTQVVLMDEKEAFLDKPREQEEFWALPITGESWEWSKKANQVVLESKNTIARYGPGHNPSIMAVPAFSRQKHSWQVKVHRRGNWVAIGLCDSNYVINGGTTLGTQKTGLNASCYFKQEMGSLRMNGNTIKSVPAISDGDLIGIVVDFMLQRAYFFKNQEMIGFLESSQLQEGKVFPCVCMGTGSRVEMVNEKLPPIIPKSSKLPQIEFFKFTIKNVDGASVERTWVNTMTLEECCQDLKKPEFSLFHPEKKVWLQGKLSDYKWKKHNKIELKSFDEFSSVESTSSTDSLGSFFNIFKKL